MFDVASHYFILAETSSIWHAARHVSGYDAAAVSGGFLYFSKIRRYCILADEGVMGHLFLATHFPHWVCLVRECLGISPTHW